MKKPFLSFVFTLSLFILNTTLIHAKTMTIDDALKVERIKNVLVAPDGSHVLYFKKDVIWLADIRDRAAVKHREIGTGKSPQWLSDSQGIAYLVPQIDGKQFFTVYNLASGEARIVSSFDRAITKYDLSPDAQRIAFLLPESKKVSHNNGTSYYPKNLWILNLSTSLEEKITSDTHTITAFDWSPDGKKIVFSAQNGGSLEAQGQSIGMILDLKKKKLTPFQPKDKKKLLPVFSPRWTPDGKKIYFLTSDGFDDAWLASLEIAVYTVKSKKCITYPETSKKEIGRLYAYSPEKKKIYYLVEDGFGYNLYALDLKKGNVTPLTQGKQVWEEFSFSKDLSVAAFIFEDAVTPPELYISPVPNFMPQRISSVNEALRGLELGRPQFIKWKSPDGQVIEGLLILPVSYKPGKQYPMVVWLHGGPASCFSNRFANGTWHYPTQVMAGEGMLVFMPNPRGSTGYGPDFKRALVQQWGDIDYKDVMSGINYVTDELKMADPVRIGVVGWSYGGYLTAAMISKSNRFKMASIGAGFSELLSLYEEIDIPDWMRTYLGTTPSENRAFYVDHSPFYKMGGITMPVLIQHGTKDTRVPVSQARLLHKELTAKRKKVVLQEYKDEAHVLTKTENKRQSMKLNMEWFRKYLL